MGEEGNINTREYWDANYSGGFYQDHLKNEWIYQHSFLNKVLPDKVCNVLEVGCGLGHNAEFAARLGHWVEATDFSDVAIAENKQRFKNPRLVFMCLSIEQATCAYRDNDVVMALEVIEHFKHPEVPLLQIYKALVPGGMLVFSVPQERGKYGEFHQHYSLFNYDNLGALMFKVGFKEIRFYKTMFNHESIVGVCIK